MNGLFPELTKHHHSAASETPAKGVAEATSACVPPTVSAGKRYFSVSLSEWVWNTLFLLSLSMVGLEFKPGNLMVIVLLLREFKVSREGFIFKLMMVLGGYAFSRYDTHWGVNLDFLLFPVAIATMCVMHKTPALRRTIAAYWSFALITMVIAFGFGVEGWYMQLRPMMSYLSFIFFAIPLLCFIGRSFDIHEFWRQVFILMFVACVFYIIDAYVIKGWVLVPCSFIDFDKVSTWFAPVLKNHVPRKYPPGLYSLALLIWPLARYYKLRWWQWIVVVIALAATKTSTTTFSLVIGYVIAQGTARKYMKYGLMAVALFTVLYFVDDSMGYNPNNEQSTMRIASTINQFADLSEAQDDEDLSEAGTGRMAQALPSLEMISDDGRQLTGYGFVSNSTENPRLIVYCEFIPNPLLRYRAVTDVEISQLRVYLSLGWVGLIVWLTFIFGICYIIRRMHWHQYYLNVAIIIMIYGVGGFQSWYEQQGILIGAMAYAAVLLANKPSSLKEYPPDTPLCPQQTTNA